MWTAGRACVSVGFMSSESHSKDLTTLHAAYVSSLRDELKQATALATERYEEYIAAKDVVTRLEAALETLDALAFTNAAGSASMTVKPPAASFTATVRPALQFKSEARGVAPPVPSPHLSKYVAPGGGTRLKSKRMLFDLLKSISAPVGREELKQRFFDHYGREELERYWKRPDNALSTAIERAIADEYIIPVEVAGEETRYIAGMEDTAAGGPAFEFGEDD